MEKTFEIIITFLKKFSSNLNHKQTPLFKRSICWLKIIGRMESAERNRRQYLEKGPKNLKISLPIPPHF